MPCVIIIDGDKYDVSGYVHKHPGEGIRQTYLLDFNGKDKSIEFDRFHLTDEPFEILIKAKKEGEYMGIKYLGKVN